jgi:hypothetical protein
MEQDSEQRKLLEKAGNLALSIYSQQSARAGKGMIPPSGPKIDPQLAEASIKQAEKVVSNPTVKQVVCGVLSTASDDLREITKVAGAALIPLAISGVISLPMTPLALAAVGIVVFRLGVASFCAGSKP